MKAGLNPALLGTFDGSGGWYDSAGRSASYRIRQTNAVTTDGFEVAFTHDFDDATVVDVCGSSSPNAEGNYIAWREILRRSAG